MSDLPLRRDGVSRNPMKRLFRGETSFDFAGKWRRWFAISALIIIIGWTSVLVRGINFSIDFKGGTSWEVPTSASVADVHTAIDRIGGGNSALRQATVTVLTNRETGKRTIEVQAAAKETGNAAEVAEVTNALARVAHTSPNNVELNDIGPSWGSDITRKAIIAVIVFLVIVTIFIWLFFEAKMALAALVALFHDILITIGIYSLSGFQVSPDTVIAFLTVLGYSLYDTIVVFDRVRENTKGLASTGRLTYTDTVNLSMNQVLARSINTSLVAILPILSILVIGAGILGQSSLQDFGLALTIGLTTGAYSSIFIASPLLALLKERETRYSQIRTRLANRSTVRARLTPAAIAGARGRPDSSATTAAGEPVSRPRKRTGETATPLGTGASSGRGGGPGSPASVGTSRSPAGSSRASSSDVAVAGPHLAQSSEETEDIGSDAPELVPEAQTDQPLPDSEATPPQRTPTRPPPRPRKKTRRR
jgi:preprotein translocase subunit SecF